MRRRPKKPLLGLGIALFSEMLQHSQVSVGSFAQMGSLVVVKRDADQSIANCPTPGSAAADLGLLNYFIRWFLESQG